MFGFKRWRRRTALALISFDMGHIQFALATLAKKTAGFLVAVGGAWQRDLEGFR